MLLKKMNQLLLQLINLSPSLLHLPQLIHQSLQKPQQLQHQKLLLKRTQMSTTMHQQVQMMNSSSHPIPALGSRAFRQCRDLQVETPKSLSEVVHSPSTSKSTQSQNVSLEMLPLVECMFLALQDKPKSTRRKEVSIKEHLSVSNAITVLHWPNQIPLMSPFNCPLMAHSKMCTTLSSIGITSPLRLPQSSHTWVPRMVEQPFRSTVKVSKILEKRVFAHSVLNHHRLLLTMMAT
jgi:hypothetical protein